MENKPSETLYQAARNIDTRLLKPVKNKTVCCCISEKWSFEHSGIATFKQYDENSCCTCLDCCSWCLEFRCKKICCFKNKICYVGCCTIYFT